MGDAGTITIPKDLNISDMLTTFDNGTWGEVKLEGDDHTRLDEMDSPEDMMEFTIAQWRVDIGQGLVWLNGRPWRYKVYVQRFAPRWLDPTIFETVLVPNFGSLMQLLTILRENELTFAKPTDGPYEVAFALS